MRCRPLYILGAPACAISRSGGHVTRCQIGAKFESLGSSLAEIRVALVSSSGLVATPLRRPRARGCYSAEDRYITVLYIRELCERSYESN